LGILEGILVSCTDSLITYFWIKRIVHSVGATFFLGSVMEHISASNVCNLRAFGECSFIMMLEDVYDDVDA